jgi:hypothetical protein
MLVLITIAFDAMAIPIQSPNFRLESNVIASTTRPPAQMTHGLSSVVGQAIVTPMASFSDGYRLLSGHIPMIFGTGNIEAPDTDNDGMPDSFEMAYGLSPTINDAALDYDEDRLNNIDEYRNATDPKQTDTDSDGMPDGWEVQFGLDPTVNDASADQDNDSYDNFAEYRARSDPSDPERTPRSARAWLTILPLLLHD